MRFARPWLRGLCLLLAGQLMALLGDGVANVAEQVPQANVAEDQARAGSAWRDLREGWTQFRSRAWVWSSVSSGAIQNLLYSCFFILGPVQAQQHYQGARGWALILTCAGAGSVAGGAISLRLRPAHPLAAGCLVVATLGLPTLALGLGLPLAAVATAAGIGTAGLTASNSWWQTALQQHIPLKVLSRVSAYDSTASFASIPLGLAIAAPIAAIAGTANVLIAAGAVQLLAGLAPLAVPDVRHLTRQPEPATPSKSLPRLSPRASGNSGEVQFVFLDPDSHSRQLITSLKIAIFVAQWGQGFAAGKFIFLRELLLDSRQAVCICGKCSVIPIGKRAPTILPCFVPAAREESRVWYAAGTRRIGPAHLGA